MNYECTGPEFEIDLSHCEDFLYSEMQPKSYLIQSAYPNPFNPTIIINYNLSINTNVTITIHKITGQKIQTLINEFIVSGNHTINWNAKNYPSGIYLIRIQTNNNQQTLKVSLLK